MTLPNWRDTSVGGTMIRGGLWLIDLVGEGNTFTKEQLREVFPKVSQADRRVRELRDYGWIIHTNTDDGQLASNEQRFVKAGVPVWDKNARRRADLARAGSASNRQEVFKQDGYMCVICGIGGGEPYIDDSNLTAVLEVARRKAQLPSGEMKVMSVTECRRCHVGNRTKDVNLAEVLGEIQALDTNDHRRLARWIDRGRRGSTPIERAWIGYRQLPADARAQVQVHLQS
ncbi:hypothetical protein AB0H76_04535 [Nocardia sp. NPDC050712]|uniref:hypothetical protein n=1 Tax=Nocardia sp. NPDC050712 TaxID=3155518 RepID=UPI0033E527CE